MSYADIEASRDGGRPVELYEFTLDGQAWHYTSGQDDIDYDGATYQAIAMGRSEIEESSEVAQAHITVDLPHNNPVVDLFIAWPPEGEVLLRIFRTHGDPATTAPIVLWMGRAQQCDFQGVQATLTCESIYTAVRAAGLRRLYSRTCPHVLYGPACGVDREAFAAHPPVMAVDGAVVRFAFFSQDVGTPYIGGIVAWTGPDGVVRRRMVLEWVAAPSSDGYAGLRLVGPQPDLAPGDAVTLYPGCDHQYQTCRDFFDNLDNFGGFPWIPNTNPFNTAVF